MPFGRRREGLKVQMVRKVNLSGPESDPPSVTLIHKESPI